jgi:multisubunit Na+/H+ antiporter MnhE subunit
VGLHVSILSAKQLANAVDGKLLYLVYYLATTIVTVARIALGILVGKVRSHGFHNLVAYEVLTRNQLNAFQLALMLFLNQLKDCVVSVHCFVYWV